MVSLGNVCRTEVQYHGCILTRTVIERCHCKNTIKPVLTLKLPGLSAGMGGSLTVTVA